MILHIHNGRVLAEDGAPDESSLTIEDGGGVATGKPAPRGALRLDARGMLVPPGIVDLHGDAFERQLMPRPGVAIDPTVALLDTDRQLLANGITAAYHAMTWSWEPGLRSRDAGAAFVAALTAAREGLGCDTRFHLRHETYNIGGEAAVLDWIAAGHIDLLAINDHTPGMAAKIKRGRSLASTAERAGLLARGFLGAAGNRCRAGGRGRRQHRPHLPRGAGRGRADGVPRRRVGGDARRLCRARLHDLRVSAGHRDRAPRAGDRRLGRHGRAQRAARRQPHRTRGRGRPGRAHP